jgi:hypothetical protein
VHQESVSSNKNSRTPWNVIQQWNAREIQQRVPGQLTFNPIVIERRVIGVVVGVEARRACDAAAPEFF